MRRIPNVDTLFAMGLCLIGSIPLGCAPRPGHGAPGTTSEESRAGGNEHAMHELATFGAGCFWGVEERFRKFPGVTATSVGYMGGSLKNPTYEDVCTNRTGHAEVVQVTYDPQKVTYAQLLDTFWNAHDPTTLNRQGPDVGTQYRSAIFFHSPEQQAEALAALQRLEVARKYPRPIVTEIVPAGTFYRAEEYHQQYLAKRGLSSCTIAPEGER
jgi:peptide-methionine (S)-S-oxide reductase